MINNDAQYHELVVSYVAAAYVILASFNSQTPSIQTD